MILTIHAEHMDDLTKFMAAVDAAEKGNEVVRVFGQVEVGGQFILDGHLCVKTGNGKYLREATRREVGLHPDTPVTALVVLW